VEPLPHVRARHLEQVALVELAEDARLEFNKLEENPSQDSKLNIGKVKVTVRQTNIRSRTKMKP
jgi:hypothetical protein